MIHSEIKLIALGFTLNDVWNKELKNAGFPIKIMQINDKNISPEGIKPIFR